MSIGTPYIRIGIGDKEVKNYMSPNVYQLTEGAGDTFLASQGAATLSQLKKQDDAFFAIPVSDIVEAESSDSTV